MEMYTCRVCLAQDRSIYVPIFSVQGEQTIAKTIMICTGLIMESNDGLTQYVCSICVEEFLKFLKLKEKCIQSDIFLRASIKPSDENSTETKSLTGFILDDTQHIEEMTENIKNDIQDTILIEEIKIDQEDEEPKIVREEWVVEMHNPSTVEYEILEDPEFLDHDDTPDNSQPSVTSPKTKKSRRKRKTIDESLIDESLFICCSCPSEIFDSLHKLETHRTEHHQKYRIMESTIRPFECDVCYQRFLNETHLNQHKKRPYKKRKFVCSSCGSAFFTISTMKKHEETCTTTELKYECNECGKRFIQTGSLRNHMKLHTSKKTHSCTICGKTFLKKFEVPIHMVTHTTEQPFPCDQCPSRFKRMQALRNHQRHHSNPTPYKCDMCDEWFNSFSSRKYHRQKVHEGIEPFRCEHCGAAYGRKSRLDHHIRKAHPSGT